MNHTSNPTLPHISVCICAFRRPEMLAALLDALEGLDTGGGFSYSIVVADNDCDQSALPVVERFRARSALPVTYCLEPRQNIARARNAAVRTATGDFVAFIDDDEFPARDWLLRLFNACRQAGTDAILGPVIPRFGVGAPRWVTEGGFYDRPRYPTGTRLGWDDTRTGNTLLKASLFVDEEPFNPACLSGSDIAFFKKMESRGHTFAWCDEALVYETVPPARWTRSFLVRRGLFRGMFSARNNGFPMALLATSLLAVPAYAAALLLGPLMGPTWFRRYLFKFSYHLGRVLAITRLNPIHQPYVTE